MPSRKRAGGVKFLLLSALIYAPGAVLFCWARLEQGQRVFTPAEWALFAVAVGGALVAVHGLATGTIAI